MRTARAVRVWFPQIIRHPSSVIVSISCVPICLVCLICVIFHNLSAKIQKKRRKCKFFATFLHCDWKMSTAGLHFARAPTFFLYDYSLIAK